MFEVSEESRKALTRALEAFKQLFDALVAAILPAAEAIEETVKQLTEASLRSKQRRVWVRRKIIGRLRRISQCISSAKMRWHAAATGE